jgi:co-chaperonin GroES (HSP10)
MNLSVLGDRVFVRPDVAPEPPDSTIVLTDQQKVSLTHGTVVAVGEGPELVEQALQRAFRALYVEMDRYILDDVGGPETRAAMACVKRRAREILTNYAAEHLVMPGDRVIFPPDAGEEIRFAHDETPLLVMREGDILGVVETAE